MRMSVGFQMDALESLNPQRDTTLLLIKEALHRKFHVVYYEPHHLSLENGVLRARVFPLTLSQNTTRGVEEGPPHSLNLNTLDVLWIRQDPPYNMAYLTATYLLEHLTHPKILNNPKGLREAPEKLIAMHYPQFMPPTLVTCDPLDAMDFLNTHGPVIVKPLYDYGGHFIYKADKAEDLKGIFQTETQRTPGLPLMVQKFLPQVKQGDKRIFMIKSDPVGCFKKIPQDHAYLSNLSMGGHAVVDELTAQDHAICQALRPRLLELGLYFVGLDVIDGYLTEVNATSPTGILAFNHLYGTQMEKMLWDNI